MYFYINVFTAGSLCSHSLKYVSLPLINGITVYSVVKIKKIEVAFVFFSFQCHVLSISSSSRIFVICFLFFAPFVVVNS